MDRDTIIRLAREAEGDEQHHGMWRMHVEDLERFAALVAAAEREACAKACELQAVLYDAESDYAPKGSGKGAGAYQTANHCAAAIRSRT